MIESRMVDDGVGAADAGVVLSLGVAASVDVLFGVDGASSPSSRRKMSRWMFSIFNNRPNVYLSCVIAFFWAPKVNCPKEQSVT